MSVWEKSKSFKDRIKRIFAVVLNTEVKSSTKEWICAWIQATGSMALAAYMYKKGNEGTLTFMFSAIGVSGAHNYITILRRNKYIEIRRNWSLWDFTIGTVTYSTGVYTFSEFCKRNDTIFVPCLAIAATGYYFTIASINSLDTFLYERPLLKSCQLMSEPVLVACASTYLFYFRNHTEKWLKCLPFLVTAVTGLKIADRGRFRYPWVYYGIVLKAVEMCMGGCFLCISGAALAIYSSANGVYWFWTAFMSLWSLYGAFVAMDSFQWFRIYAEMDASVLHCICGIIGGPIVFILACISFKYINHPIMLPLYFVISGTGLALQETSVLYLYRLVPLPVFLRYHGRVMGPVITVCGSLYAAYVGYHVGWRFSFVIMPVIASGIYITYDAFRRRNEFQ